MTHDVFVSYAHTDKQTADAAVAAIEAEGLRCWVAPRDVTPGANYMQAITEAIKSSRILVLIFSESTENSNHVTREVEVAVSNGLSILPVRIQETNPGTRLQYALAGTHWLDALTPPMESHLKLIASSAKALLREQSLSASATTADRSDSTVDRDRSPQRPEPPDLDAGAWPKSAKIAVGTLAVVAAAGVAFGVGLSMRSSDPSTPVAAVAPKEEATGATESSASTSVSGEGTEARIGAVNVALSGVSYSPSDAVKGAQDATVTGTVTHVGDDPTIEVDCAWSTSRDGQGTQRDEQSQIMESVLGGKVATMEGLFYIPEGESITEVKVWCPQDTLDSSQQKDEAWLTVKSG